MPNDPSQSFARASQILPDATTWLWPGWLPKGKITLFEGDPGLGKSFVTLDLCARLTTGRPMPDGSPSPQSCTVGGADVLPSPLGGEGPGVRGTTPPANVLVINGEDKAHDIIVPRLKALDADLDRVYVYSPKDLLNRFSLPSKLDLLKAIIADINPALVVIDPITYFLDACVCVSSDHSIRQTLGPLDHLADSVQSAFILVRHLTKSIRQDAIYRGAGSVGFIAACRTAWLIARNPRPRLRARCESPIPPYIAPQVSPDSARHGSLTPPHKVSADVILAQQKNNHAPIQASMALELGANLDQTPIIHWSGPSTWTSTQLLARGTKLLAADRAAELLEEFLYPAPRTATDIWDWAKQQHLGHTAVEGAKKKLEIRTMLIYNGTKKHWWWLLPHHSPPDADTDPDSLEPWLKPLREMYPSPTPLDDDA